MLRRAPLLYVILAACTRQATPPIVEPMPDGEPTPTQTEPLDTPQTVIESEPQREPAPSVPFAHWQRDPRITDHLRASRAQGEPDDAPPQAIDAKWIFEDPSLRIEAVISSWTDADPEKDREARERIHRVHLLVRTPTRAHVVDVARQYRSPGWEPLGDPQPPTLDDIQWNGVGAPGPDLVLTVSIESIWGTQCEDGLDARTDVIVCELDEASIRCGRAPVEVSYFDGCGGEEVVDRPPGAKEPPCSRVGFRADWVAGPEQLELTMRDEDDLFCLDDEEGSEEWGEPRPPAAPRTPYETLLTDHALRVVDVDAAR